ncbi:MAG: hypothetical protein V1755_06915 [Chloroflexota bacterium]
MKPVHKKLMLSLAVAGFLHAEDGPRTVLVHYMPWYASKPVSGHWGWHWTMDHFNPDRVAENGPREVASHYYPLIGPYDSSDPHALECHVLLMKLAGIDGAIIDWYGTKDYHDYAAIHRNAERISPSDIVGVQTLETTPRNLPTTGEVSAVTAVTTLR